MKLSAREAVCVTGVPRANVPPMSADCYPEEQEMTPRIPTHRPIPRVNGVALGLVISLLIWAAVLAVILL